MRSDVLSELERLGAKRVIAVGAVSQEIIAELELLGFSLEVIKGQDRWATAALVSARILQPQGVFVIGADAVPDAVSVASFAAANGYLIQLAELDGTIGSVPDISQNRYILGGPTLVEDIPGYTRIYGIDRYATNALLREVLPFDNSRIYYADGSTLVDALTGAILAAQSNAAIVLVPDGIIGDGSYPNAVKYALGGRSRGGA